jgi:hypothetical protein
MSGGVSVIWELGGEIIILLVSCVKAIRRKATMKQKVLAFLAIIAGCIPIYLTSGLPYDVNRLTIVGTSYISLILGSLLAMFILTPKRFPPNS